MMQLKQLRKRFKETQKIEKLIIQELYSTVNFTNVCYEASQNIANYLSAVDWNTIESSALQLYRNYEKFGDAEKGDLIAHTIGKYGVDIFAGITTVKCLSSMKKLREANTLCNLEALAESEATKQVIVTNALKYRTQRQNFFNNVKIHWDRQNKHIPGKHNYEADKYRSILTHSDPERLLKDFAGKGISKNNIAPGIPGYVERVDFGEVIGFYINEKNANIKIQTTKGTIKYSTDGAHIVPSNPNG